MWVLANLHQHISSTSWSPCLDLLHVLVGRLAMVSWITGRQQHPTQHGHSLWEEQIRDLWEEQIRDLWEEQIRDLWE